MHAQVEKRSRAVTNSVAQKRSNGNQGIGFVDNRAEAVAQRKLQVLHKNSPQAMRATTENFDVVQQKALAANKLNVVGENHPESNARRPKEQEYAEAHTGGGIYEKEGAFKSRKWWLFGNDKYGDPMLLRAEMLLAILKEKVVPGVLTPFSTNQVPAIFPQTETPAALWGIYKDMLKNQLDEISLAMVLASNEKAEQTEAVKAINAHTALVVLSGGLATSVVGDVATVILPEINRIITTFANDVLGAGDIRPEATISALRSSAMQEAAEKNAARWIGGKKGVWKVGQDHIAEIAAEKQGDKYELMTRDEFNADFDPWLLQHP